ncbi:hypothetical protein, partial [Cronobacter sakazakii]|uniref:hypothetical protein n=1 Tax=Cronobacter sakazakii TaxID=28141 RepID=UPI003F8850F8
GGPGRPVPRAGPPAYGRDAGRLYRRVRCASRHAAGNARHAVARYGARTRHRSVVPGAFHRSAAPVYLALHLTAGAAGGPRAWLETGRTWR